MTRETADSDRDGSRRIDRGAAVAGAQVSPADGPTRPDGSGCVPGASVPARVSVTGGDGRSYGPEDAWMHADDSFDRGERPFEYGYFHSTGGSRVTVPTGRVDVEVSRGPEYRVERRSLQVKPGARDSGSHRAQASGESAGRRLVQRRPSHPHELRRQLPQHAPTPGVAGPGGGPPPGGEPHREQGRKNPRHLLVLRPARPGLSAGGP